MNAYTIPDSLDEFARDLRDMQVSDPVAYAQLRPIYEIMHLESMRGTAYTSAPVVPIERAE